MHCPSKRSTVNQSVQVDVFLASILSFPVIGTRAKLMLHLVDAEA